MAPGVSKSSRSELKRVWSSTESTPCRLVLLAIESRGSINLSPIRCGIAAAAAATEALTAQLEQPPERAVERNSTGYTLKVANLPRIYYLCFSYLSSKLATESQSQENKTAIQCKSSTQVYVFLKGFHDSPSRKFVLNIFPNKTPYSTLLH